VTTAKPIEPLDPRRPVRDLWPEPKSPLIGAVHLGPERLLDAARALVADSGAPTGANAQRFLSAAAAHGLDLDNTWGVLDERGKVRHVALATPGSGKTHMLFTSRAKTEIDAAALAIAIDASCRAVAVPGLAQALLEPGDVAQSRAFLEAGFRKLALLGYLRRKNPRIRTRDTSTPALPEGVSLETWRPGMDDDFVLALERSYEDTLDCPELRGVRNTRDVLESHKAAGDFEPPLWWIIRLNGEPQGAMIFAPGQDHGHIELVYLGLAPPLRGKRLGALLLEFGLRMVAGRREPAVTCAVDQRNEPAKRLYRKAGFVQIAERAAFIRPV
jgi:ribosomal protein S18 acetylase RimI-like enzyme